MKAKIITNEGVPVATVSESYEISYTKEIPDHDKQRLQEALMVAVTGDVDTPDGDVVQGDLVTPPERYVNYRPRLAFLRLSYFVPIHAPYQVEMATEVGKQDDSGEAGETLEIRDYYRVWMRDPESAPGGVNVLYDREGDPAGNHYYYEVPFESSVRVDIGKHDRREIRPLHKEDAPDYDDLVSLGVSDADLRLVKHLDSDDLPPPTFLTRAESPLTLYHLYERCYKSDTRLREYLPILRSELDRRDVGAFERISKERRYIEDPSEAPEQAEVHEGPRGGLYYETDRGPSDLSERERQELWGDDYESDEPEQKPSRFAKPREASEEIWNRLDEIPFTDFPEYTEEKVRDGGSLYLTNVRDDAVAEKVLDTLTEIKDKVGVSAYSTEDQYLQFRATAPYSTVMHEFGHATADALGYRMNSRAGNVYAVFYDRKAPDFAFGEKYTDVVRDLASTKSNPDKYQNLIAHVDSEYPDKVIEPEDFQFDTDAVGEGPLRDVMVAVNRAWERMAESVTDPDKNAEEYIISRPYAMTNAHETMAVVNEAMQSRYVIQDTIETLYTKHSDLLRAYLDFADTDDGHKQFILRTFEEHGPNEHFPHAPFGYHDAPDDIPTDYLFELYQLLKKDRRRTVNQKLAHWTEGDSELRDEMLAYLDAKVDQ